MIPGHVSTAVLLLLVLTTSACTDRRERPIADSVFVEILTDLHLAEAQVTMEGAPAGPLRDSVLMRHGATETELDATFEFYARDPDAYLELYDRVIARLNEIQQEKRLTATEDRVLAPEAFE